MFKKFKDTEYHYCSGPKLIDLDYLMNFIKEKGISKGEQIYLTQYDFNRIEEQYQKRFGKVPSASPIEIDGVNILSSSMIRLNNEFYVHRTFP